MQGSAGIGSYQPMIRDKRFYRQFFMMCTVLILQNVITLSVNLADNIMLGAYSEAALSGVTAVNQIQFIYQQLLLSFGEGIVILGGQYFGKKQMEPLKDIAASAMHLALGLASVLFFIMLLFPSRVLLLFTDDAAIIAEGVTYVRIIRFTYLFFAVTQILLATLRSVGVVRISLALSVLALLINCSINYTLIYGHFGAPRLGVKGAAIGTLVSRIAELIVLIVFIAKKQPSAAGTVSQAREGARAEETTGNLPIALSPRDYLRRNPALFKDYFRVTWPMSVVQGLWGFNMAFQNAILGHMTARAIAANSASSTMYSIVKAIPVGACGTAAFFTARAVGEGDENKIRSYAKTMQVLFVLNGLIAGTLLFFLRGPILSLYLLEPETMDLTWKFTLTYCVIAVTMSYQMPCNNGIIRGGGDTKFTMKLDLISIWCIVLPVSFIAAFVLKASPVAVVWCLSADQIFKCVPAFIKVNYGHWAKKLTR